MQYIVQGYNSIQNQMTFKDTQHKELLYYINFPIILADEKENNYIWCTNQIFFFLEEDANSTVNTSSQLIHPHE